MKRRSMWWGLVALVAPGVLLGACGGDRAEGPSSAPVTLGALAADVREGLLTAMRVANPVESGSELVFRDREAQVVATVGESSTVVTGLDGARVRFGEATVGRQGAMVPLSSAAPHGVNTARVTLDRRAGGLEVQEWWHHGASGVQQGFTVQARPAGEGPLHVQQTITSDLTAEVVAGQKGVAFWDRQGERLRFDGLVAFDAMGRDLPAVMHVQGDVLTFEVDDTGAVFPVVIDPVWSQQAYLKASNTGSADVFGWSVAVSGDTIVVGAPEENGITTDAGAAYVFVRSGGVWSQQAYLKASNAGWSDYFGYSVAISGDTIVVGALYEDSSLTGVDRDGTDNSALDSGAAYVFTRSGGVWSQQAYLKASNTDAGDFFGYAVAVSGDTVVVGARSEGSNATGVGGNAADNSAWSAGAAYVFVRSGGVWSQQAYVKASNTDGGDSFGWSVAVSGDTMVVSAPRESSNATGVDGNGSDNSVVHAGAAYVFVRSGGVWSQQAYLKASHPGSPDEFGYAVAVSGDTVVVGAPREDSNATGVGGDGSDDSVGDSGAAYVFTRTGAAWSQQAYLKASNTDAGDYFGYSVAVSGDTVVIGAAFEDSNATGVDGDGSNDSAGDSGAAYVFARSGGVWSHQAYVKASNTDGGDSFGWSVAVSGDTMVVAAPRESSNATGVGGNEADDSAGASGAVYVGLVTVSASPAPAPAPAAPVLPPLLPELVAEPAVPVPTITVPPPTAAPTTVPTATTPSTSVPVPTAAPTTSASEPSVVVSTSDGSAAAVVSRGDVLTVLGEGYAPDTSVEIWLRSTPVLLGSTVTNGEGSFSVEVSVPGDVESGSHTLYVEGTTPTGGLQGTSLGLVVEEPGGTLPATGTAPMTPWALLLLVTGVMLVTIAGHRRTS